MSVMVPVSLTPAEEAALVARAQAEGVSVDALLHQAVLRLISPPASMGAAPLTADEWEKEFEEWLDSMPDLPSLSDQAISRESIYTREDEWR
jgi:hypothetical protein